ncbi:hypothetical protein [Nostoc sp. NMS8]|uniref:hypothetical protein n=1 Tax=Nostoc sp. NMS8 TaxID=2815392 RepID=UPI0025D2B166|nr:hypothetical protein [Nostoc sp. NMS8]MBN3959477.1 hypothetical protein [Nostoc sp. NMS8]
MKPSVRWNFTTCVYTVAQSIGATTGGLKRSQILTNDLGLLYKQQIPRSHVEVLESRVEVLESRVEILESCVEVLKSRVEVLESCVEVLKSCVEVLKSRVEVLESRVGVLQTLSHRNQVQRCDTKQPATGIAFINLHKQSDVYDGLFGVA